MEGLRRRWREGDLGDPDPVRGWAGLGWAGQLGLGIGLGAELGAGGWRLGGLGWAGWAGWTP